MDDERVKIRQDYMKDINKNSKYKKFPYSGSEVKIENYKRTQLPRSKWIETTFQKRECNRYIKNAQDELRCCCGRLSKEHILVDQPSNEEWLPSLHTELSPTDAYGTIEFQGGPHPKKAQYIRVSYDTPPELLFQVFTREWKLEPPRFLITIRGGKANFDMPPKLKKSFSEGLLRAAKTTGVWLLSDGLHTGVTKQVGDVLSERSSNRLLSLGIAPWGIIENNHALIGLNQDVPYHSISSPRSRFIALNSKLTYFIFVDNGTHGKYGAEIILRRKLEKFISKRSLYPYTHNSTPVVCLVIEGGPNTIRAVLEYVTDNPPVPVVICDGSGRAADLIALAHKYASASAPDSPSKLELKKDHFITKIQNTFEVDFDQAECLYGELVKCTKKKNLITIFKVSETCDEIPQQLDETILTALFTSQHLPPSEQLGLALAWNRVDIARSEIFVYGQEWPPNALDEAMLQALKHDRMEFVKLLLENGVSMKKFLTIPRLEKLYNTKKGPSNTLGSFLKDVVPYASKDYVYSLYDIGLVINKLMGGAYRVSYTRRRFKPIYDAAMNNSPYVDQYFNVRHEDIPMSLAGGVFPNNEVLYLFDFPFNELLIWAVLTKRQNMALLMWEHGEEALAKALVACKLYKSMAHEAAQDDMEIEVCEELRSYGKDFGNIALELLDFSYRQDDDQTLQYLICELPNWSGQTCLSLAVAANHRDLLAHPCSQIILVDLWMGGLKPRNTNFNLILALLVPPFVLKLEFKSLEEVELMRQEKHVEFIDDDYNYNIYKYKIDPDTEKPLIVENESQAKQVIHKYHSTMDENYMEKPKPLKIKIKFYEFYTAPIIKFWANFIAYIIFLTIFSYVILVKMYPTPTWQEYLTISFIVAMGFEKIREIISGEPMQISQKYAVWKYNIWNPCDAIAVAFFFVGLCFRLQTATLHIGRVIYCVDSIYWYLRLFTILGVNKYFGPLVTMMGKMIMNLLYFVILLLVVLLSFGVSRHAILYPDKEPSWTLARDVFYEPYFMMYGELFSDRLNPDCEAADGQCVTGRWITIVVMSIYLLIANILLINLLIAVFNNIFTEVNAIAQQLWMFQRYSVVLQYEQKAILPPPFSLICHLLLLFKYFKQELRGKKEIYDSGLKLFLEKDDMEKLYDFEEECMEGYFAEQESILHQSVEERVKLTTDKVETMLQKVNDINAHISSIQNIELRMKKLENSSDTILTHLADIHRLIETRFESASTSSEEIAEKGSREKSVIGRSPLRLRPRGKLLKSLTEVRPDSYSFDDDFNYGYKQMENVGRHKKQMDAALGSALHIENKLLMDAEKNDYMLMEKLIEKRCSEDNQIPTTPSLLEIDIESQGFVSNFPPAGVLTRQDAVKEDHN